MEYTSRLKDKVSNFAREFKLNNLKKDYWLSVATAVIPGTLSVWFFTKDFVIGCLVGVSILGLISTICNFIKIQIKFPDQD